MNDKKISTQPESEFFKVVKGTIMSLLTFSLAINTADPTYVTLKTYQLSLALRVY